jgi:hypothetical protein
MPSMIAGCLHGLLTLDQLAANLKHVPRHSFELRAVQQNTRSTASIAPPLFRGGCEIEGPGQGSISKRYRSSSSASSRKSK